MRRCSSRSIDDPRSDEVADDRRVDDDSDENDGENVVSLVDIYGRDVTDDDDNHGRPAQYKALGIARTRCRHPGNVGISICTRPTYRSTLVLTSFSAAAML